MDQQSKIDWAASALKRGEAVIFPTDTVYGLGISIEAAKGPDVLYRLKKRDCKKPIAWLVGGIDDLAFYGKDVPAFAFKLAGKYWPGPLTLVVNASEKAPLAFCSDQKTIGLRMPDNACALNLIAAVGCPLATTSANISGAAPTRCYEALDRALFAQVSVVISDNADSDKSGVASTVIDCTRKQPRVLRQGSIVILDSDVH